MSHLLCQGPEAPPGTHARGRGGGASVNPVEFDHVVPVLIFIYFIRSSKLQISHNRHPMRRGQHRGGTDVGKVG